MIKKIPYLTPDNSRCRVELADGIIDGHENTRIVYEGPCFFSQSSKRVQNKEGLWVPLAGTIQIAGDIAPDLIVITGKCSVNNSEAFICRGTKRRNPDGTVHHTLLELGVE